MWKEEKPVRWDDITIGDVLCVIALVAIIIFVGWLDNPADYYFK